MLAVLTVNSDLDNTISGDGLTTLREAVAASNFDLDTDTISFDLSLFRLSGDPTKATITFTEPADSQSALIITDDVIIEAPTGYELEVSAASLSRRVFEIDDGSSTTSIDVTLRNLAITNGTVINTDGGGTLEDLDLAFLQFGLDLNLVAQPAPSHHASSALLAVRSSQRTELTRVKLVWPMQRLGASALPT